MELSLFRTLLEDMILARTFEERAAHEYTRGRIGGFLHLYPGEEAVAAGVIRATGPGDYIVATYREHAHALLRGIPPGKIMAELFGRETGLCRGMGGSMHLFSREHRFMGGYAIVGETFPVAIGIAYALAMKNRPEAVVCFFGDGAVNQGTFHESLNMAALWNLPVLFVCENNRYQIGTEIHRHSAVTEVFKRSSAYHIPGRQVDGMDVLAVHEAATQALGSLRSGGGPALLECVTYRFRGHSMADPGSYRPSQELAAFRALDPVPSPASDSGEADGLSRHGEHCLAHGAVANREELQSLFDKARERIEAAVEFSEKSSDPSMELFRDLSSLHPSPTPVRPSREPEKKTGWQAINRALDLEMSQDERVFVIGEDVGLFGGAYRATEGLMAKYGEWRVRDTPISENSFTGLGVGAAMAGMRPVVEIMTVNFALLAMDALVNLAAKIRLMSGGQFSIPLVLRMPGGVAHQLGAQHSQRIEAMLMNVPGLRILAPSSPQDSLSLLRMAIRSDDPVVILEHDLLYFDEGPVREDDLPSLDSASVLCEGSMLTLVAWSRMTNLSLSVARNLKSEGISVEVIDLRSLSPVDWETLVRSTEKTHRALIVEEDGRFAGGGAEIAATLSERCHPLLDAPIRRLGGLFVPTPYNKTLEASTIPDEKSIEHAIRMSLSS